MPTIALAHSPLAGGPAEIFYRDSGSGRPLLFLHGGWGYQVFPLDLQAEVLASSGYRVIVPDRSGYGRSTKPAVFGVDFHRRAVEETLLVLDALGLKRCVFWGHSDGAVISILLGLAAPERCRGLILEATHYDRAKLGSRDFFDAMVLAPESYGERVCRVLRQEHGDPYWRELLAAEGRTWIDIAHLDGPKDLYHGRLSQLTVPVRLVHGAADPRTETGEIEAICRELPHAKLDLIASGGHCPHTEASVAAEFNRILAETLAEWGPRRASSLGYKWGTDF